MSGAAHTPYLLCSLASLRRHWDGPVTVYAWSDSIDIVRRIGQEDSLGIEVVGREPAYRGKNGQFADKIALVQELNAGDTVLYLDADTTIHGRLDPLFDAAEVFGFCATRFNEWTSNHGIIRKRLEELRGYSELDKVLLDEVVTHSWPSVNGGVWATNSLSPVLPLWYQWTKVVSVPHALFIGDERVLHLLMAKFVPSGEMKVVGNRGEFNSSPHHQSIQLPDESVVVRHYHGDSNVRPAKTTKGFDLWWPQWQSCLAHNIGGCREWEDMINNKWMNLLK